MLPFEMLPSPQEMTALKSLALLSRNASAKEATAAVNATPWVSVRVTPTATSMASDMVAVPPALADAPPLSVMVTEKLSVPSMT